MLKTIDINTWSRKQLYDHFTKFQDPYFGVTIPFDVTKAYKKSKTNNYSFFGEVGIGEDIDEGTPVGSGSSFDYIRFGVSKTFFDSFKVNVNYRSKMKSDDRDLNWIVINTKYKF